MVPRVESSVEEWSWSVEVAYACACGAYSPVTRWRWVDAEAKPELAARLREAGPLEGRCKACQRPAEGGGAWLELTPGKEQASLVLAAHQRGELLEALQGHLELLRERPALVRHWLLQPRVSFASAPARAAVTTASDERGAGIPRAVGQRGWSSGPTLSAEIQRAVVCDLSLEDGVVTATAVLDEATRKMWGSAALQARPVLLRGLGYPLLGVRLVASYLGEVAVIDAVVDVGAARTSEIFVKLAQAFRLQLLVRSETGQASAAREIEAANLQRNAALCLESAQGQLGTGEFPPDAYRSAREALARMSAKQRLEPARHTLAEGSYRHLVSPAEALAALERVDAASRKDNLARLLEVDGLPFAEYEAMRKAVLAAAIDFGLVAPARFWRRVIGTDLVQDAGDWIGKLVSNRSAWLARGDDLTAEQAEQAWRGIYDLCQHHDLTPPPEVAQALGIGRQREPRSAGLHVVPAEERAGSGPVRAATSRAGSGPVRAASRPPSVPAASAPARSPAAPSPAEAEAPTHDTAKTGPHSVVPAGTVREGRTGSHAAVPAPGSRTEPGLRSGAPTSLRPEPTTRPGLPVPGSSRSGSYAVVPASTGPASTGPASRTGSHSAVPPTPRHEPATRTGAHAVVPPAQAGTRPRPEPGTRPRRSQQPAVAVSGEIGGGAKAGGRATSELKDVGGSDPKMRVSQALAILEGPRPAEVMPLLAELDEDELLALLPPLAEVGTRLVPELLARLEAPERPLRQAATILLGLARDRRAIDPLAARLGAEGSAVWIDVARALGNFGPRVVGPLCALLRGTQGEAKEALGLRVARTFAELVVSDGDAPGGAGRLAIDNLLEVADPSVSSAARRALATLADVRGEARGQGAGVGVEDREIRRFGARAYEAITTPELDADGDFEVVGED